MDWVENQIALRSFDSTYGPDNKNTWDFMSSVTQHSYLTAYELVPSNFDVTAQDFKSLIALIGKPRFEELSRQIFIDAIDSVSKVWLRAWKRYQDWASPKK
jgi:hypothetical protein